MNKVKFNQINGQQLVDLRNQKTFQEGHIRESINLNPKNLIKYGPEILDKNKEIVLITSDEADINIDELTKEANKVGIQTISSYLNAGEIPTDKLEVMSTITVEDFMNLDDNYQLLDVRHPNEITRLAPNKNLINIPLENLADKYKQLKKEETIYTLCGSGNRATTTSSYLNQQGYHTIVIEGGMGTIENYRNK